jgi:hypothetical protein
MIRELTIPNKKPRVPFKISNRAFFKRHPGSSEIPQYIVSEF